MFNSAKSYIVDAKNDFFARVQSSKFALFCADSLIFKNIDNITLVLLILTLIATAFCTSGVIGLFAILTSLSVAFKLLVKKGERLVASKLDFAITLFLTVAILSLFGSSLFLLSLKGFVKILIYIVFYFCAFHFLYSNRKAIPLILAVIASLVTFESVIGILQNHSSILPISTWQDTSNLDVHEVMSRCYGTLKPYNPNLLAGYILAGISSVFYLGAINFLNNNKKRTALFFAALLLSFLALIYSGSRGGYLGLFAFIAAMMTVICLYVKNTIGFENIKKRYKNILIGISAAVLLFIVSTPAIYKRILSIFAFREDSSISFRLNVYEASFRMFLDNFFIGIGLGNQNFREIYGLYMKTTFDALGAYSVPLEIAVEMGIFGLLAFAYFICLSFKYCIEILKSSESNKYKALAASIFLMLTATMVHGLWDTVWYRPQVQIIFWLNIAILNTLILKPKLTPVKEL